MKGYYLFAPVEAGCVGPTSGIERKVRAQCAAINQTLPCELMILPVVEYAQSPKEKIIRRLPFTAAWRQWRYNGEFDDADFVYIRAPYFDSSFVRYLKKIRKANPKIQLILEIPTYPPTWKSTPFSDFAFKVKDVLGAKHAARQVDALVNFYDFKTLWNRPCICTLNGYDFSRVELPTRPQPTGDVIHLISVSVTAYWHGYDRIIEGLHRYYEKGGKENFIYHLVGSDTLNLHKTVEEYHLQDRVILYGNRYGEELNELYRQADIGFDVLGGHRNDYPISSSLKSREYGAWGLPLITASRVDYLPETSPYQRLMPYDESPLDFDVIADYYHKLYDSGDRNELAKAIRQNAESLCGMAQSVKPVVDWLTEHSK